MIPALGVRGRGIRSSKPVSAWATCPQWEVWGQLMLKSVLCCFVCVCGHAKHVEIFLIKIR